VIWNSYVDVHKYSIYMVYKCIVNEYEYILIECIMYVLLLFSACYVAELRGGELS
jgi:hypothetical protein